MDQWYVSRGRGGGDEIRVWIRKPKRSVYGDDVCFYMDSAHKTKLVCRFLPGSPLHAEFPDLRDIPPDTVWEFEPWKLQRVEAPGW